MFKQDTETTLTYAWIRLTIWLMTNFNIFTLALTKLVQTTYVAHFIPDCINPLVGVMMVAVDVRVHFKLLYHFVNLAIVISLKKNTSTNTLTEKHNWRRKHEMITLQPQISCSFFVLLDSTWVTKHCKLALKSIQVAILNIQLFPTLSTVSQWVLFVQDLRLH